MFFHSQSDAFVTKKCILSFTQVPFVANENGRSDLASLGPRFARTRTDADGRGRTRTDADGQCCENVVKMLRKCCENVTKMSRKCHANVAKMSRKCPENDIMIL